MESLIGRLVYMGQVKQNDGQLHGVTVALIKFGREQLEQQIQTPTWVLY